MDADYPEQNGLEKDIQELMKQAKQIQQDPLAFLHQRQHLLGEWMGQSLKN